MSKKALYFGVATARNFTQTAIMSLSVAATSLEDANAWALREAEQAYPGWQCSASMCLVDEQTITDCGWMKP